MMKKSDHFIIAGLGIQFALVMCLGFFGGRWLDRFFNSSPLFLLICCVLAFMLGIYMVVKSANIIVGKEISKGKTEK